MPSPEQIISLAAAIRATWSPQELATRIVDDRTRMTALGRRYTIPLIPFDEDREPVDALWRE
jgi:hypothetical protein